MCERKENDMNTTATKYSVSDAIRTWILASSRIMWSSVRHPNKPIIIDYTTGKVWLKDD